VSAAEQKHKFCVTSTTNKLSPRAEFHWNLVGSARRCAHLTVDFSALHANELRDVAQRHAVAETFRFSNPSKTRVN